MNIIKNYINYLKDNPNGYWFKKKLYGYGWIPATWQGWLVVFIYVVLVLMFALTINNTSPVRELVFTFILPVALLTFTFIRIAYKKGEKLGWQWGLKKK
jgi:hypothetical protein